MTDKKRVVSLCLSLILIFSFAGCKNREDSKNDVDGIVSTETIENKTESSIVGTWVVVNTELYEGPLQEVQRRLLDTYYPIGAEYIFTDDGVFKGADGQINTTYEILSEGKISCVDITTKQTVTYEYELNGDELIFYGVYTSGATGRAGAIYYKRKG